MNGPDSAQRPSPAEAPAFVAQAAVPQDWTGFESLPPRMAEFICLSLLAAPVAAPLRERFDRAFVLMIQGSPHPASELLQECYAATGECLALHLLGSIELSLERYEIARAHLLAEQICLASENRLGQAANAWQLGLAAHRQRQQTRAENYTRESLSIALAHRSPLATGCALRLLEAIQPQATEQGDLGPAGALAAGREALASLHWQGVRELDLRLATMVWQLEGKGSEALPGAA